MNYNIRFAKRWNDFARKWFVMPSLRRRLKNRDFSLFSNNCNGGFIYHDLGLRFNSPTINLFFYKNHFFTFLEHLSEYLNCELRVCHDPEHKPETEYPIFNLGGDRGLPLIELHFLHYHDVEKARDTWYKRCRRVDLDNVYAIFSFFDDTDEDWLKRFDAIDIKNKVAFVNRPFPQYKSAFYIPGYEKDGLQQLGEYMNLKGNRKYDYFDFVGWFNKRDF